MCKWSLEQDWIVFLKPLAVASVFMILFSYSFISHVSKFFYISCAQNFTSPHAKHVLFIPFRIYFLHRDILLPIIYHSFLILYLNFISTSSLVSYNIQIPILLFVYSFQWLWFKHRVISHTKENKHAIYFLTIEPTHHVTAWKKWWHQCLRLN